jgi:hypothetical protein
VTIVALEIVGEAISIQRVAGGPNVSAIGGAPIVHPVASSASVVSVDSRVCAASVAGLDHCADVNDLVADVAALETQLTQSTTSFDAQLAEIDMLVASNRAAADAAIADADAAIASNASAIAEANTSLSAVRNTFAASMQIEEASVALGGDAAELSSFLQAVAADKSLRDAKAKANVALAGVAETQGALADTNQALASVTQTIAVQFGETAASINQQAIAQATVNSAVAAEITTLQTEAENTSAALVNEEVNRSTADQSLSGSLTIHAAAYGSNDDQTSVNDFIAAVQAGQKASEAAKKANVSLAGIAQTNVAVANAYQAIASISTQIEARFASAQASIIAEQVARADGDSALSAQITTLTATVDGQTASISAEQIARANGDSALTASITSLTSTVNGHTASISSEAVTRANADSALSSSINSLTTTVNGHTSTLSTYGQSIDGLSVKYGVVGTINGQTGGFIFQGVLKNDGSVTYNMEFDSNVTINGDLVVNGTISTSKVAVGAISATTDASSTIGQAATSISVTSGDRIILIVALYDTASALATTRLEVLVGGSIFGTFSMPGTPDANSAEIYTPPYCAPVFFTASSTGSLSLSVRLIENNFSTIVSSHVGLVAIAMKR